MAYQVNKYNGTLLTSVEDGTIDTTTDLRFIGKNYAGYGEVQNENFLHLLENFANTSAPQKVITGQIWYDSTNKKLKFYDGARFKIAGGAEPSATAPSGLAVGEFWWDTTTKQLYAYTGTDYVLVGPEASPELGASVVQAQVVKGTDNNNYTIVKVIAGGKVIALASQSEFTLNSSLNPISGFGVVKKGITLINTNNTTGVTSDDHYFWGTASNSVKLAGRPYTDFLLTTDLHFTSEVWFDDPGFLVGNDKDLRVWVDVDDVYIENKKGTPINFRITVTPVTDERDVMLITADGVVPGTAGTYDLGSSSLKWDNVYANTVIANVTGNITGNSTGVHTGNVLATDTQILVNATTKEIGFTGGILRGTLIGDVNGNCTGNAGNAALLNSIASSTILPVTADKTSIPVRNSSGNIIANQFVGTADKADRLKIDDSATDTDPNYRSAKTTATANTIVARDGSGDMFANLFQGTATAARYADLAEKYLADAEYEVGTVVMVGGEKEVTAGTSGKRALGVVSANPAFMMNKDLEGGTYVALKGRVPVKVYGRVNKGDELVAGENGLAVVGENRVFAIALEDNDEPGVKLVEAVVL